MRPTSSERVHAVRGDGQLVKDSSVACGQTSGRHDYLHLYLRERVRGLGIGPRRLRDDAGAGLYTVFLVLPIVEKSQCALVHYVLYGRQKRASCPGMQTYSAHVGEDDRHARIRCFAASVLAGCAS
eukprot:1420337-Amphidinium_carterae.2